MIDLNTFKANYREKLATLKQEVAQLQSNIAEYEKAIDGLATIEEAEEFMDNFDIEHGLSHIQLF